MKLHVIVTKVRRVALVPLLVGGTVFQLGGCDPTVREALLTGLQTSLIGLLTAMINAFFLMLRNTTTPTTQSVQAVFEFLHKAIC